MGDICASAELAGKWADEMVATLRFCWTDPNPGNYFHGTTACLSCLLVADRHQQLLDLLELHRYPMWHYRRYGVEALLAMGKKADAVKFAEATRGLNQSDAVIDRACEEILISSGLHEEGNWFATAKALKLYELSLQLASQSPCESKTLTRAAKDFLDSGPEFALGSALAPLRWLNEGWGYDVTSSDVIDAYELAVQAASNSHREDVLSEIRVLLGQTQGAGSAFVRQSLSGRLWQLR